MRQVLGCTGYGFSRYSGAAPRRARVRLTPEHQPEPGSPSYLRTCRTRVPVVPLYLVYPPYQADQSAILPCAFRRHPLRRGVPQGPQPAVVSPHPGADDPADPRGAWRQGGPFPHRADHRPAGARDGLGRGPGAAGARIGHQQFRAGDARAAGPGGDHRRGPGRAGGTRAGCELSREGAPRGQALSVPVPRDRTAHWRCGPDPHGVDGRSVAPGLHHPGRGADHRRVLLLRSRTGLRRAPERHGRTRDVAHLWRHRLAGRGLADHAARLPVALRALPQLSRALEYVAGEGPRAGPHPDRSPAAIPALPRAVRGHPAAGGDHRSSPPQGHRVPAPDAKDCRAARLEVTGTRPGHGGCRRPGGVSDHREHRRGRQRGHAARPASPHRDGQGRDHARRAAHRHLSHLDHSRRRLLHAVHAEVPEHGRVARRTGRSRAGTRRRRAGRSGRQPRP